MDDFDEMDELELAAEVEDEPLAPEVGDFGDIQPDEDVKATGSSDVSQAWQDNNTLNIMNNYGLVQSLEDLGIEVPDEAAISNIMNRYKEQNGSYGLTEPQFYEVIEELRGVGVGGGRKRRSRKTRKGGKKSKKSRKSRKLRKTRKGKKVRKGRKTRK
jgi:hypothetical protein